jgi:O-antigen/teichoic acid export membrane protein
VAGAAVQAVTGSLFWLIAARTGTSTEVGHASALFTSVMFVNYLVGLGLPVALARYAPDRSRNSDVVFTWGVVATVLSSLVGTVLYLRVVSPPAADVLTEGGWLPGAALFWVMVLGAAMSMIVDVRLMTARRWNLVLARMVVVGFVRIPLLAIPVPDTGRELWLFLLATAPTAVSGLVGVPLLRPLVGGRLRLRPAPPTARPAARYSLVNWLSTLAYGAPYFALPVIVLVHVSPATNASFYVAWSITQVVFYVPSAIGQALLAEGGKDGAQVHAQVRLALGLALALMAAASVGAVVCRSLVVTIYGPEYREAARILPVLMAAGIPWAVSSLYLTEVRVRHRHVATVAITAALTLAILGPAVFAVPASGVDGAMWSWLGGNAVAAVVAVVAVRLSRLHRSAAPADGVTAAAALVPAGR